MDEIIQNQNGGPSVRLTLETEKGTNSVARNMNQTESYVTTDVPKLERFNDWIAQYEFLSNKLQV